MKKIIIVSTIIYFLLIFAIILAVSLSGVKNVNGNSSIQKNENLISSEKIDLYKIEYDKDGSFDFGQSINKNFKSKDYPETLSKLTFYIQQYDNMLHEDTKEVIKKLVVVYPESKSWFIKLNNYLVNDMLNMTVSYYSPESILNLFGIFDKYEYLQNEIIQDDTTYKENLNQLLTRQPQLGKIPKIKEYALKINDFDILKKCYVARGYSDEFAMLIRNHNLAIQRKKITEVSDYTINNMTLLLKVMIYDNQKTQAEQFRKMALKEFAKLGYTGNLD